MVTLVDRTMNWAGRRPAATAYTFMDYAAGGEPVQRVLTWSDTHRRAAGLAARLCRATRPGDRVAVLARSGLEYVVALHASWYARTIAVPLFAPDLRGHAARLAAC
jgi:fatty acid CoA ligase FadD32